MGIRGFTSMRGFRAFGIAALASGALILRGDMPAAAAAENQAAPVAAAFVVQPYLQLPTGTGITVMWETNVKLPGRVEFGATPELGASAGSTAPCTLHEIRLTGLKPATSYFYRVRSGPLVSDIQQLHSAPPPGTRKWRMALYGDSRSSPSAHRKVVEQIARANVNLILHTGDIVQDGRDHSRWQKEFFAPLAPIAGTIPWVSTIGNHERDSANYFSYMALPGNKHYFSFDYANAHIICLDSNAWIARGRDSEQFQWLQRNLHEKRKATWTFVAFHHPLFSAHANRPINALRWDWAALLLDPASHVDGVLAGHDHFYARDYRIGFSSLDSQPGVLFLTSAGGGAPLYPAKQRDYVDKLRVVHHFTLFEFGGDRVTLSAVDREGQVFDRYVLTKQPTPPEQFCAFEVEQIRQFLRTGLASLAAVPLTADGSATVDMQLSIPTRFQHPIAGKLRWSSVPGWHLRQTETEFSLRPKQPLIIPLQAKVDAGPFAETPRLTIEFEKGHFRNRTIEVHPCKLGGPTQITAAAATQPPAIDGRTTSTVWKAARVAWLVAAPPHVGRADRVWLLADPGWLYVRAELDDPAGRISVPADAAAAETVALLSEDHFRVRLNTANGAWTFAISPRQTRYTAHEDTPAPGISWRGVAKHIPGGWSAELAIPRKLLVGEPRINLVHHIHDSSGSTEGIDLELCPTYRLGTNPDRIPDWKPDEATAGSARLVLP